MIVRLARRLYRALLPLHPSTCQGFALDMAATFDALLAAAAERGRGAIVALVLREIGGLLRAAWHGAPPRPASLDPVRARWFTGVWPDARYALRAMRQRPAFAAAVILTLGLGIGANTAIVSLVNALLLQRLPFERPDRVVMIWEDVSAAGFPHNTPAPGNYADVARAIPALSAVAAIDQRSFNLTDADNPEKLGGAGVTTNLFSLLGVRPIVGRVWRPDEDLPGRHVALLSYGLWQRRFNADPLVVDRPVTFDGVAYTILGVLPARFELLSPTLEVWTPIGFTAAALQNRGAHYLWVVGRMADGSSLDEVNVQLRTLATRLQHDEPGTNRNVGLYAVPLRDDYLGDTRKMLALLLAAVGLVLLIACANVANLLLARASSRTREVATRAALGASRARLVRQILTESLLLALLGGVLGIVIARLSFGTLATLVPEPLANVSRVSLDWRVLAATAGIACLTAILFGLVPAIRVSHVDLASAGGLTTSRGAIQGPTRLGGVLVVSEIALATVLLIGAGLVAGSFRATARLPLGFVPDQVMTMQVQLPRGPYGDAARRTAFVDALLDRVRALPGVSSAGITSAAPLVWKGGTSGFVPEGVPIDRGLPYDAANRVITPGYMETLRMTLRSGRFFDARDTADGQPVAIINDRMARQYWPGLNPVGRRFQSGAEGGAHPVRTIVGVVEDTYVLGLDRPTHAEMYFPVAQSGRNWMWPRDLVVRSTLEPSALVAGVRQAVHQIDPVQPIAKVAALDEIVAKELQVRRTQTGLMRAFAGLALVLAALGIYGLLSYAVSTRTTEIGIRLALGGNPARVRALVVRQGLQLSAVGLGLGIVGASGAARLIEPLLFQVEPHDPWTFVVQPAMLALICVAAVYLPAHRASRVDPLVALRSD